MRYDAVVLLTEPDEVHGRLLEELDSGDEVEVLSQGSAWIQVRTPTRHQGWLPRMTVEPLEPWDVRRGPAAAVAPAPALDDAPDETEASRLDALLAQIVADRARAAEAARTPDNGSDAASAEPVVEPPVEAVAGSVVEPVVEAGPPVVDAPAPGRTPRRGRASATADAPTRAPRARARRASAPAPEAG